MQLKDATDHVVCEEEAPTFKARPLNPHLFEHASRLPFVERKSATNFQEFQLSSSNTQLGKRTFNEYLLSQAESKQFKARALDRKILQRNSISGTERRSSTPRSIQVLPFQFKTDERG